MQPAKISIIGDFIDSQIYRGRLYLWTLDGTLCTYNWNDIVDSLYEDDKEKLAYTFTFKDGHYLYKHSLTEIFQDEDFRNLLLQKMNVVSSKVHVIKHSQLKNFLIQEQDVPGGEIPTDTEIYKNNLYFINDKGVFQSTAHRKKGNPVSTKPFKLWDCKLLSIKANRFPQIALSGGDEGLYELDTSDSDTIRFKHQVENRIGQISEKHSSFANYNFLSIYSSSLVDSSFMAYYGWKTEGNKYQREYQTEYFQDAIFEHKQGLSWGAGDKIYLANKSGIDIVRFSNDKKSKAEHKTFSPIDHYKKQIKKEIIGGSTAYFGNIIEFIDGLWVVRSDNEITRINKPVTRWRIYPRSINYENQLHVILDDRLEVYSFNHDYFISQVKKTMGLTFSIDDKQRRGATISYMEEYPF